MASVAKVDRVLDAAYDCLTRHGIRKTTMDDIAAAAGMSRPAVYQYVRNKEDAYRRLAQRIYGQALDQAQAEAVAGGTLTQRLDRVLAVKLGLTQALFRDTPHAGELLRVSADLDRAFADDMADLLAATITDVAEEANLRLTSDHAREVAVLALALTRGLEGDADPDRQRDRLRNGVALLIAGLAAATAPR